MILDPGIHYDVSHADYHADPSASPSLSASLAKVLLSKSPCHAWEIHPRFGGKRDDNATDGMDLGEVVHSMVLGGGREIEVIDADDWRTKAAKESREAARLAGKIPMLARKHSDAKRLAGSLSHVMPSGEYSTEVTAIWESLGCPCRCRVDILSDAGIDDLKITENAAMAATPRHIIAMGYHIQAASNLDAIETLIPEMAGRARFRLIFAENKMPFGVIRAELSGELLELGRVQWRRAKREWSECLSNNDFPLYSQETRVIECPAWAMTEELTSQFDGGSKNVPF